MTENTEQTLTVEDILNDQAEELPFNPICRIWQEVLSNAEAVRDERITPQWAARVISSHKDIHFDDMPDYRDLYYARILQLREVLDGEIEASPECLNATTADEDLELNTILYINVIIGWQKTILSWELDWDCTHADAAIDLATIIELHKMFFDPTGLASLLDQINFEFSETNQELLTAELEEMKSEWTVDE